MKELIDRKSLIDALRKDIQEYKDTNGQSIPFKTGMIYRQIEAIKIIEEQPTVEAIPVVHGEWVNEYINRYGHPCHCCSVCGFHASYQDKNFCPECGADMRKKVWYDRLF